MKRGFTLIELMIVIIIIGVLATIGMVQYQFAIEKSRGAEAKAVIGYLRGQCAAIWMGNDTTADCTDARLNLGIDTGAIPNTTACTPATNFFYYEVPVRSGADVTFRATRCVNAGKSPRQSGVGTVTLKVNYTDGTDSWTSTGGY